MIFLRDLLKEKQSTTIEYRINSPVPGEDMLYGYAFWNGRSLESIDGDSYYLNDVIEKYEYKTDEYLTIWIEVVWSGGERNND